MNLPGVNEQLLSIEITPLAANENAWRVALTVITLLASLKQFRKHRAKGQEL